MQNILIIGGTGSLGSELSKYYYNLNWNVTVFSRDGHKQQALASKIPNASFILGDVANEAQLFDATIGQSFVINAAAQKIVFQGETNVNEFVRVNITGAENVARACMLNDVPVHLFISSDKAVNPVNLYGKTKAVAEDIILSYNYNVLRYGNVVDSRGSFWGIWNKLLHEKDVAQVRIPYPTRFFLLLYEAVNLVHDAVTTADRPCVFVPRDLVAFSLKEVAQMMFHDRYTTSPLLPGEKQHEVLLADGEQGEHHSPLLSRIWKGYTGTLDRDKYNSGTAERIPPNEFMAKIMGYVDRRDRKILDGDFKEQSNEL